MDIDPSDLMELFFMIDTDQSGTIDQAEFVNALSRWLQESKTASRFVKYNVMRTMNEQVDMRRIMEDQFKLQKDLQGILKCMSEQLSSSAGSSLDACELVAKADQAFKTLQSNIKEVKLNGQDGASRINGGPGGDFGTLCI
eukprot:TRINITY_DN115307_c0_g1_i1.p1 TRINITY_DN115307_c0_g1~~TRINITY_DN115307_c0_g1_i1.p1  ORF type:complete len:149 (-),score=23.97 TRINITY_DN115307_c0_g1_i1:64-486(-)